MDSPDSWSHDARVGAHLADSDKGWSVVLVTYAAGTIPLIFAFLSLAESGALGMRQSSDEDWRS